MLLYRLYIACEVNDMVACTCCFTGHRPQSFSWKYNEGDLRCILLKFRLKREIVRAIKQDCIQHFLTGMALGVDTWAAEIVLSLRKRWHVTLECVLPCHDQDARWPQESRERYQSILAQCDKVTLLQTHYSPDCFDKRNRYLIDHSDLVIAVWNGSPSGTGSTIAYAAAQGKPVRQIHP